MSNTSVLSLKIKKFLDLRKMDWIHAGDDFVQNGVVVSGGTGVGKTTLLNLFIKEMSPRKSCHHWGYLELSLTCQTLCDLSPNSSQAALLEPRDLLKNALRMRPVDIIGEIRGGELFDLLQAIEYGAWWEPLFNSCEFSVECLQRMETLLVKRFWCSCSCGQKANGDDGFCCPVNKEPWKQLFPDHWNYRDGSRSNSDPRYRPLNWGRRLKFQGTVPQCMERIHHMGGIPLSFFAEMSWEISYWAYEG